VVVSTTPSLTRILSHAIQGLLFVARTVQFCYRVLIRINWGYLSQQFNVILCA
jgi:hypothetical protein